MSLWTCAAVRSARWSPPRGSANCCASYHSRRHRMTTLPCFTGSETNTGSVSWARYSANAATRWITAATRPPLSSPARANPANARALAFSTTRCITGRGGEQHQRGLCEALQAPVPSEEPLPRACVEIVLLVGMSPSDQGSAKIISLYVLWHYSDYNTDYCFAP
jgi:hypothetical protein